MSTVRFLEFSLSQFMTSMLKAAKGSSMSAPLADYTTI